MKGVVIHCSDSTWGNSIVIDRWHRERFDEIGYPYVILNGMTHHDYFNPLADGLIEIGRRVDKLGAHCHGFNQHLGICLIGESGKFTQKQEDSLIKLLKQIKELYKGIEIFRHSDLDPAKKAHCPGISDEDFNRLKTLV